MGNNKKVGTFRSSYKKRKNVGKPKCSTDLEVTPTCNQGQGRPKDTPTSTSKLKLGKNFEYYRQNTDTFEYEIMDVNELSDALSALAVCKFCHQSLKLTKKSIVGLATKFRLFCEGCDQSDRSFTNSKEISVVRKSKSSDIPKPMLFYDINLRLVYGLRIIGKGYTAAQSLCGMLNLPSPPTLYTSHQNAIGQSCNALCEESVVSAVEEAVTMNEKNRDLCVALDGSWQKRGFTSLNGVMTLTSVDTGKVLDFHCMSKYCQCPLKNRNEHLDTCTANYNGTSGGMEVEGAITLFHRSIQKYNVRYTEYLGDGDSAAYKSVVDSKPYEDCDITKLECIGHIQKRMGSRLRKLKSTKKAKLSDGKSLSGKNRLTDLAIQKIQLFYGLAIRRNTASEKEMQKAVWATYYHILSSNENPTHQLCPPGNDSWCKYRKAIALDVTYDHSKHFHLSEVIMLELKPIFKQLSDPTLLKKCLKGKSQNPNESLNNLIWSRLPKKTFVGLSTLNFGVSEAVLSFNNGYVSKAKVLEHMGLQAGKNLVKAMETLDRKRVYEAEKSVTELEKKIRLKRTMAKRLLEDQFAEQEDPDNPSYAAGGH